MDRPGKTKAELTAEIARLEARLAALSQQVDFERDFRQAVLDATPWSITISDLEGTILEANRASCAAAGFAARQDLIGQRVFDLMPERERARSRELFAHTLSTGRLEPVDATLHSASGEERFVELGAHLLRDREDRPFAVMGTTVGTEARRRLAEAERQRVESFQALNSLAIELASAPLGSDLHEVVAEKLLATCGAAAVVVSAYDPQARELVVRHVAVDPRVPTDPAGQLRAAVDGLRMPVSDFKLERMLHQVINKPRDLAEMAFGSLPSAVASRLTRELGLGELRGLALHHGGELVGTVALLMPAGTPVLPPEALHVLANMTAVSMRRMMAEEALRESNERFELFMEHLPSLALIKDSQHRIVFANRKYLARSAKPASEIIGRTPEEIWPSEIAAKIRGDDDEVLLHGRTVEGREDTFGSLTFANYKFPIPRDKKPPLVGGFTIDVTERRRIEEERRQLDSRVLQTQKLESLGVLAGGIAHDFNNLLTAILGHANLAMSDVDPEEPARESLQQVIASARCAAELTRQMLAFAGKGNLLVRSLDLSKVIEEMAPLLEISASKKSVIKYELERDLPPVEADVSQLRQVLMNLVTNASEAIGDSSGLITIGTSRLHCSSALLGQTQHEGELAEGLYVCLSVRDSGAGMDAETLPKIYDPFFTTRFAGRGLGLAAVLGIVRAHHGAIHAESEPGRGTLFRLLLPPSAGAPEELIRPVESLRSWRSSGTVLVVDDEDFVRTSAVRILKRAGFEVVTANDGLEAIEAVHRLGDSLRLILLDASMPRMDGIEALGAIRTARPKVKIVLSSGYCEQEVTSKVASQDLAGFAQKPYGVDDLLAVVRKALEG